MSTKIDDRAEARSRLADVAVRERVAAVAKGTDAYRAGDPVVTALVADWSRELRTDRSRLLREYASPGEQFTASAAFTGQSTQVGDPVSVAGMLGGRGRAEQRAAITSGGLVAEPLLVEPGAVRTPVASACTTQATTTSAVTALRWSGAFGAAVVPEGGVKPEEPGPPTATSIVLPYLAAWVAVSRAVLEDVEGVRALIDGRLRASLASAVDGTIVASILADAEVLTGSAADVSAATKLGYGLVGAAGHVATTVLVNPTTVTEMDLGSSFPLTIVPSVAVPADQVIVGDLAAAVTVFARGDAVLRLSDSHGDSFLRNQLVILAEQQAAGVVVNPTAVAVVTVSA